MRRKPPSPGKPSKPEDARRKLRLVLGDQEATRRRPPEPIPPLVKAALEPPPQRGGPPGKWDPELAEKLLARMWAGEFPTRICGRPGFPTIRTVQRWAAINPEFRDAYELARKAMADAFFEDAVRIADDASRDLITTGSGTFPNPAAVLRARLRVETRLRVAGKLNPKRYGPAPVEHTGEFRHVHMIDRPPEETREQWIERRRRELAALPAPSGPQTG